MDLKDLELIYWLRPFTVDVLKTRYRLNYPFRCLYLQKTVSYSIKQEMHPDDTKLLSFQVTENNLEEIKELFEKVGTWFTEDGIKELYGVNDDGLLMFNMEYKDLKASYANEFAGTRAALQVVPAPVEVAKDKLEPGVVIFINKKDNTVVLRTYQIKRLLKFFKHFDFMEYDKFAMQAFQYAHLNNAVINTNDPAVNKGILDGYHIY